VSRIFCEAAVQANQERRKCPKGRRRVVSVYRTAPGHRDELEKSLAQAPGGGQNIAGNVLMQHLEGGPWQFLTLARYNSWQDFATSEKNIVADTLKPDGGWLAHVCTFGL
jgi:hypothetical protein